MTTFHDGLVTGLLLGIALTVTAGFSWYSLFIKPMLDETENMNNQNNQP